jgi:hypothetical protein
MLEGAQPLVNVYRIYYKLMKTTLEPQALMESPKGKTLLLQASTSDSHTRVPTQINWNDVKLPNRWLLQNVTQPTPIQSTLEDDLDYIDQHPDGSVSINFQPFRKSTSSCSSRYSNPYKEKIVSPPRCNFNRLKLQENPRIDDDLRHSIDRLDNLRFAEEEDRTQKLDLDKFRKSSTNSNYTNPNLDGIIKGNVINTPFYSTSSQVPPTFYSTSSQIPSSSQIPQKRPNSPTNSDMGYFPPHMYDPQINMIKKPFELNKERLRKDFMSPKYENRIKEFFATFSEFLRNYIRDKYYEFMNDIQTEVNFFEWFDNYYKPKILAGRNTNTNPLLQRDKSTNHTHRISNTPSNTPSLTPLTKTHACDIPDTSHNKLLTLKQQITDNIHLATKQTLLTSQYGQINTIKKNKKDNTHKDKKKPKKDKKDKTPIVDIVDSPTIDPLTKNSEEKVTNHKPLCYKCKKLGHYQNNCVSDKKPSKLKTPDLHSEINSLKQEIKEIKTSSFQITEEQLAQEMVALKIIIIITHNILV